MRRILITIFLLMVLVTTSCGINQMEDYNQSVSDENVILSNDNLNTPGSTGTPITPTPSHSPSSPPKDNSNNFDDIDDLDFSTLTDLEFWFGSGAGAWSTIVTILPDGTFNGYYYDADMGDVGDDYPNGTRYECYFSGQFSSLRKTGDYEYSMKCESLKSEGTLEEEKIVDGVKLVTSEPYGFDNADEFFLYLPGKETSELSDEFLSWSHSVGSGEVLTSHGLYNVGGKQGFIVWPK